VEKDDLDNLPGSKRSDY